MRSNELHDNKDIQHLLRIFRMGGGNEPDDGFTFPSFMPSPNRYWLLKSLGGLIKKETSGKSCLNYANTSKVNDGHGDNNDGIFTNAKRSDANIVVLESVLAAKIHEMERQMLDDKLVLVDNECCSVKC
nr:calmodulin-binding protein 60 B-like [Tanacetum cinerariifolium]